jgi:hypothetical protein
MTVLLVSGGCTSNTSTATGAPSATTATTAAPGTTSSPSATQASTAGTTATTAYTTTTPGGGASSTTDESEATQEGYETQSDRLSPTAGDFSTCKDCHAYLDPMTKWPPWLVKSFSHELHLTKYGADCASCHPPPVHTELGVRTPTMDVCFSCHGVQAGAKAPGTCDTCHPPDFPRIPSWHTPDFYKLGHSKRIALTGTKECFTCHKGDEQTFCVACHGLPMPHPAYWATNAKGEPGAHVSAAYADGKVCVHCHGNTVNSPANCYGGSCHGT